MSNSPEQIRNNSAALADILQVPEFDLSSVTDSYPENLVLPPVVHHGIQEALAKTDDGYERSRNFYYDESGWSAGRIATGSTGRPSILHWIATEARKLNPTIFVHTHPPVADHYAVGVPFGRTVSKLMGLMRDEDDIALEEARGALPSHNDVASSFGRVHYKTLCDVVASRKGTFLFLRNPDEIIRTAKSRPPRSKEEKRAQAHQEGHGWAAVRKSIRQADAEIKKKIKDPEALHPALATVVAVAVRSRITCYATTESDNPELARVVEAA